MREQYNIGKKENEKKCHDEGSCARASDFCFEIATRKKKHAVGKSHSSEVRDFRSVISWEVDRAL